VVVVVGELAAAEPARPEEGADFALVAIPVGVAPTPAGRSTKACNPVDASWEAPIPRAESAQIPVTMRIVKMARRRPRFSRRWLRFS
jgi:hypothetical protein